MAREVDLRIVLRAVNRASAPLGRIARGVERIGAAANRAGAALRRVGTGVQRIGTAGLTRVTAPLVALGGFALRASGFMEQLGVSFESMLGSADAARRMTERLANFAARTPFELRDLGSATKQLLAFGVAEEHTIGTLKILGDIAAGASVPLGDLAQIYGKTLSKGRAQTEELNQLAERGVPIIDALAKYYSEIAGRPIGKAEVFKGAEEGRIRFEDLAIVLERMTEEGGIFENQMEKQSQTLFGLASTLKDNLFNALVAVGDKIIEVFRVKEGMRKLIAWIGEATKRFLEFADTNPKLTQLILIVAGIAAVAAPALFALGLLVVAAGGLVTVLGGLATAVGLLLSPFGLVAAAAVAAAVLIYRSWDGIVEWMRGLWSGMFSVIDVDGLLDRLRGTPFVGAVLGWFEGLSRKVGVLWGSVTRAVDVAGLLAWVREAGIEGGVLAWFDGLPGRVSALWTQVTAAFGMDNLLERLRGADIAGTVKGWLTGLAASVASLWATMTRALGVDALLARLRDTDIAGTVKGWLTGLAASVASLWATVTGAFGTAELITRLQDVPLLGTVKKWFTGLDGEVSKRWATVLSGIGVGGFFTALGESMSDPMQLAGIATSLLAGLTGAIQSVHWRLLGTRIGWAVRSAILAVGRTLGGILAPIFEEAGEKGIGAALLSVVKGLGKTLLAALRGSLDLLIGFIEGAFHTNLGEVWERIWTGLKDMIKTLLPDVVVRTLGIDETPETRRLPPPGGGRGPLGSAAPLAFGSSPATARTGTEQRIGGRIQVEIVGDTTNARIRSVTSESDDVPVEASIDYIFADAAA